VRKVIRLGFETGTSEVRSRSYRHLTALLSEVSCLDTHLTISEAPVAKIIEQGFGHLCSVRVPAQSLWQYLRSGSAVNKALTINV
jgi:hypothetical protein